MQLCSVSSTTFYIQVDISIHPPYIFLLHSELRIFAAFKIPTLTSTDPILTEEVPFIRPHLICPLSLPTIFAVQFINPWTYASDSSVSLSSSGITQTSISFYLTVVERITRRLQFLRYDVCVWSHPLTGAHVQVPTLRQRISLDTRDNHDLISPSVVSDELSTFWGTSTGIVYVPDRVESLNSSSFGGIEYQVAAVMSQRISQSGDNGPITKPRIAIDAISGKRLVIQGDALIVEEFGDTISDAIVEGTDQDKDALKIQ